MENNLNAEKIRMMRWKSRNMMMADQKSKCPSCNAKPIDVELAHAEDLNNIQNSQFSTRKNSLERYYYVQCVNCGAFVGVIKDSKYVEESNKFTEDLHKREIECIQKRLAEIEKKLEI